MVTETMQDSRRGRLSATSCDVEHATVMQEDLRDCSCLQLQAANPGLMRRRANIDRDILGDGRRGRAGHSTLIVAHPAVTRTAAPRRCRASALYQS